MHYRALNPCFGNTDLLPSGRMSRVCTNRMHK